MRATQARAAPGVNVGQPAPKAASKVRHEARRSSEECVGSARITPSQLRIVTVRHGLKVFVLILPCFGHFGHPRSRFLISGPRTLESPGRRFFCPASGGFCSGQIRPWLDLVDLSRIPSGTFFREVHPGSEMASQNDQNKAK